MYRVHAWYKESVPVPYMCVCTDGFGFGKQHTYKTLRYFSKYNIKYCIVFTLHIILAICHVLVHFLSTCIFFCVQQQNDSLLVQQIVQTIVELQRHGTIT